MEKTLQERDRKYSLFEGMFSVIVIIIGNGIDDLVQILDETDCTNALGKA